MNQKIQSKEKYYCEGGFSTCNSNYYILGLNYAVAKTKIKYSHEGSNGLDNIISFDLAEIRKANLSQINMITVSSFCGPTGFIWGLDICKTINKPVPFFLKLHDLSIEVFLVDPLVDAFVDLTGTVEKPRFPFLPGSHVPCAMKKMTETGKRHLYTSIAVGIPEDRSRNACLLMEDVGEIPLKEKDIIEYKRKILENIGNSVIEVGLNQNIKYKTIYIGIKSIFIDEDEIGCVLVAAPYLKIAQNAFPGKGLDKITIEDWEKEVNNNFLYKNG